MSEPTARRIGGGAIPIILIGIIDFTITAGHAGAMAPHQSIKRRYVDLLLVASAVCRAAGGPAAPLSVG
jgi:hypothetical protein